MVAPKDLAKKKPIVLTTYAIERLLQTTQHTTKMLQNQTQTI